MPRNIKKCQENTKETKVVVFLNEVLKKGRVIPCYIAPQIVRYLPKFFLDVQTVSNRITIAKVQESAEVFQKIAKRISACLYPE